MNKPSISREREAKLGAFPGFTLPLLDGAIEGLIASPRPSARLDATYYDTPGLTLARWGITVRHRLGEGLPWTVKLPDGEEGPALVRREISYDGDATSVPPEVTDLLRAYVRTQPFGPVARLRTTRRGVELRDVEGHRVADVVDDEVSVYEGRRLAARFREVEVEVFEEAPNGLLEDLVARMRDAGAGAPDRVPKVVRALGARATAPPELVVPRLGSKPSAGEVIQVAIAGSVARILRHDPGVRIGDDPEDVHQARVGTRRLRSDLRTFRSLLDPEWLAPRREELKWLADLLGAVRDADVLLERLRRQAQRLPEHDAAGVGALVRGLAAERDAARVALLQGMSSPRYAAVLDDLVASAAAPALLGEAGAPARDVLPGLVRGPWRHLEKAVRDLPPVPADEDLHGVRILAKRMRYAAEAAVPAMGKEAQKLADAVSELQTVLGDHQDACVAEAWLRQAAEGVGATHAFVAGELAAQQRGEAQAHRAAWPEVWKSARRGKLRAWME